MLIVSIEEINPADPVCKKLAEIGALVGIMDMRQAYMLIEPYAKDDGIRITLELSEGNQLDIKRLFFALAVFNYASFVHDSFEVPSVEVGLAMKFSRKYSREECEKMVNTYLTQFYEIVKKYGV